MGDRFIPFPNPSCLHSSEFQFFSFKSYERANFLMNSLLLSRNCFMFWPPVFVFNFYLTSGKNRNISWRKSMSKIYAYLTIVPYSGDGLSHTIRFISFSFVLRCMCMHTHTHTHIHTQYSYICQFWSLVFPGRKTDKHWHSITSRKQYYT